MFKIESYITPIIMNHVAKYVKNIRPQDAQLSLWEGEALFQNLDLRLDVLEEELSLPFDLISGHIHELSIRVPWTKITSEPIKITINTIEFVLKLRGPKPQDQASSSTSPNKVKKTNSELKLQKRSIARQDEIPQHKSAYSALITKIINNIVINCHNIILKYIQEDIVVSLNAQLLSFGPTNEYWQMSMVDVNPVKVLTRKLVKVSDLTICLDKRNAAGHIEVCQEPILYRCSLECRILRKYNIKTVANTSTIRIGILTKSLEVNISSMQFPLLMHLILNLLSNKYEETAPPKTMEVKTVEQPEDLDQCAETDSSYLSWAWSLLPSFSFEPFENEDSSTETEVPGHTVDIGFYVELFNFTLKNAEFINENIIGATKRIRYTPVMRIIIGGIYFERISSVERFWSNFKAGITTICIEPMGSYRFDDQCQDPIMQSATFDIGRSFIDKSLFDDGCLIAEKGWGVTSYEEYANRITDEYLLYRSPIFAFDMVKYKPKQLDEPNITQLANSSDIKLQYRILSNGLTFRYTESFLQVTNIIKDYINSFDYSAYYAEQNIESTNIPPALQDDYDRLMINVPLQIYKFKFANVAFQIYPKLEPSDPKIQKRIARNQKHVVPHFLFFVESVNGTLETPLEPDLLVRTTFQLDIKPDELVNACYNNYHCNIENLYVSLSNNASSFNKFLNIPKVNINYGVLIQPVLWKNDEIPEDKLDIICDEITIEFSKREMVLVQRIIECVQLYDDILLWRIIKQAWRPKAYEDTIKMQNRILKIHKSMRLYATYSVWSLSIQSLNTDIICNKNAGKLDKYEILSTLHSPKWLEFKAQFSRNSQNDEYGLNVIALWIEKFNLTFDPILLDFLNYHEEFDKTLDKDVVFDSELVTQPVPTQSNIGLTSALPTNLRRPSRYASNNDRNTRKPSNPAETIHLSSERDDKVGSDRDTSLLSVTKELPYKYWLQFIKNLILNIEIAQGKISVSQVMDIRMPTIVIKSLYTENIDRSNMEQKITIPNHNLQKDTFNYSFSFKELIVRCGTEGHMKDLISPLHTNITISLIHKIERYKEKQKPAYANNEMPDKNGQNQNVNQQSKKSESKPNASNSNPQAQQKNINVGNASSSNEEDTTNMPIHGTASNLDNVGKPDEQVSPTSAIQKKRFFVDAITINVHADTTPINIFLSNEKFKLIKEPMSLVMNIWYSLQIVAVDVEDDVPLEPLEIVTAAEENASIKEFFELESTSASSRVSEPSTIQLYTLGVFCQLAITKAILELQIVDQRKKHKCVLEFEDLLMAIDKHNNFLKFTTKVGDFKFQYIEFIQKVWLKNDSLRIQMLSEGSGAPYFHFIYTIVTSENYYQRIGAKRRKGDAFRIVCEIIISMELTEIILDLDKLVKFLEPWQLVADSYIDYSKRRRKLKRELDNEERFLTATMLPMILMDSKGFILYLPVETFKPLCSVAIAKIESINITNTLKNPLQRNPIRIDVWSKASHLGMLQLPGTYVEDRQYEITFNKISAATGNWREIKTQMQETANSYSRLNPALEWNNPNRKTSLQFSDFFTDFKFVITFAPCIEYRNVLICGQVLEFECASDFVSTCTTAQINLLGCLLANFWQISRVIKKLFLIDSPITTPAKSVSDSLISTLSQENSVQTALIKKNSLRTTLSSKKWSQKTLNQKPLYQKNSLPKLKSSHSMELENIRDKKLTSVYYDVNASTSTIFKSIKEDTDEVINTDSGFMSCDQNSYVSCTTLSRNKMLFDSKDHFCSAASSSSILQEGKQEFSQERIQERIDYAEVPVRHIPYQISLVAGIFILKLYETKRSVDNQKERARAPLLSFTLTQPSFIISQSIFELTKQVYLFNINVDMCTKNAVKLTMPTEDFPVEEDEEILEGSANIFPFVLVGTKLGKVDSTGIQPPIFRVKINVSNKNLKEVEVEVAKPIVINIAEDHIERFCNCIMLIYDACFDNICVWMPPIKKVVRDTKIKLVRKQFFDADRIQFKLDNIELKIFRKDDYNGKIILSNAKASIRFLTRPEKAVTKVSIGAFYVQTDKKIFVHPINARLSIDFITEPWNRLPLVKSTVKCNVVQLDIGVYAFRTLLRIFEGYKRIKIHLDTVLSRLLRNRSSQIPHEETRRDSWLPLKCPTLVNTENLTNKKHREEFYQDDLRAGAFQFVEMTTDAFLPLPYQIQIIKKNFGIICWRYPQPRKMVNIKLFPVPIATSHHPTNIRCRMEYFSETHERFMEYLDFCLSETVSRILVLPEHEVCANIWRVVIMQAVVSVNTNCFDDNVDDDDIRSINTIKSDEVMRVMAENMARRSPGSEFVLHPKALVGCLRIDTAFQSECVPRVQLLVSVHSIMLSFQNQPDEHVLLPSTLKKFKLTQTTQISQTFMILFVEHVNVFLILNSLQKFTLNTEMTFHIKCIDYGYLNMVYLLEECRLQNYLTLNKRTNSLQSNMILNKICINVGPAILHTLLSSKKHWEDFLKMDEHHPKYAFIPKCIIVNRTHSFLSFGQTGTTEKISLKPRECYMYTFRSDYYNQELTFSLSDSTGKSIAESAPVPITFKFEDPTRLQYIRMGDKCIIIKSRKLSSSQIYILIKGQIEILSMVNYEFNLEICGDMAKYGDKNPQEYAVVKKSRGTFFRSVQRNSNIAMRMKFTDIKGKLRSGDIPLKSNKQLPWLVKVPQQNNQFISFWVRVLREDIKQLFVDDFQPQKLLITIWPIFEICSMLTTPISAEESTTRQEISLAAGGGRQTLNVPATHLSEHELIFSYEFPLCADTETKFALSLKNLNWHKFFWYDEKQWTIEKALDELSKGSRSKWPIMDENELRIRRSSTLKGSPSILYKCAPSREFGCSMALEVAPWGLFINTTGTFVSVFDIETQKRLHIEANCMEMMFALNSAFIIKVENGVNWYDSLPIYYGHANKIGERCYVLHDGIVIEVVIPCAQEVTIFMLEMKIESCRRIFIMRSKYCITNFTKMKLCLMPFALGQKETTTRHDIKFLDSQVRKKFILPVQSLENCIGVAIDCFNDINCRKIARTAEVVFSCFICIKVCEESDISIPILLQSQFTRKCFSISNEGESIPLVTTLIEKNGIFYLNIFDDERPAMLLNNQTEIKLFVGETNATEHSRAIKVAQEYSGKHFTWHQILPAYSKVHYTPPIMCENFPEVESTKCNLTIAICSDKAEKKGIKWSKPIRTDKTWEKFLNVPNYGDVRVVVCEKHKIIRVTIYYIAERLEFSVKDLRTRLSSSPSQQALPKLPDVADDDDISVKSLGESSETSKPEPTAKCIHFRDDCGEKVRIKIRCLVKDISLRLKTDDKRFDYKKNDVMAMCIDDLVVAFDETEDNRQINVLMGNLQIDNQLFVSGKYDFPVVLCSQELYMHNPLMPHIHALDAFYEELKTKIKPIAWFILSFYDQEFVVRSVTCRISPIRAYIEDSYLTEVLDALLECEPSNCVYEPSTEWERVKLKNDQILLPKDVAAQAIYISEPMKLQSFRIEPLSVLLSVHTSVRLYIALDHSPLSFSAYEKYHIFTVPLRFGQSVGMHYLSGALFGAGWVVGSLEILGSPSCLARSFSTGLRDFVSMPVEGLFRGPWGFVVGITQGSASLLRNVTAGTVNSVTKLAASVARNLDRLTLDQDHIARTEALRRSRPQGFTEGFSQGITGLGISILGAVGGLARHTLEARSPVEVVTGVGKGLVGVVTKPISGAVELVALAGQGMLHTVGFNAMPLQRTPASDLFMCLEPSPYRIWNLLPGALTSDQILFYQDVTIVVQDQLRKGYAVLTSAVFAIMESQWDTLAFVYPADKMELRLDRNDKTLVYVRKINEGEEIDENQVYQHQRIMNFLQTSTTSIHVKDHLTSDSLYDILQESPNREGENLDLSFYITEHMGEYLVHYLKIINNKIK